MSVETFTTARAAAFSAAQRTVEEWRASGRHTTTAGVTSVLKAQGVLDLEALGVRSNREFWEVTADSGELLLEQQSNGHWLLLLPGESAEDFLPTQAASAVESSAHSEPEVRLKSDVWTSFVDWNPAYRRFWDRAHARAFMTPVDPGWVPETLDTGRFAEIGPALQDVQFGWMRAFADTAGEPDTTALLAAIGDHAPRGAFRRELRDRGLARAWRLELRERVLDFALTWAADADVEPAALMETRPRTGADTTATNRHRNSPPVKAASFESTGPDTARRDPAPRDLRSGPAEADSAGHVELLRSRLHAALDNMSYEEMSGLRVRAEHLIAF